MTLDAYLTEKGHGSAAELAARLGLNPQNIGKWRRKHIPAERVIAVWRATDKKLHPREIRPDLYPPDLFE